MRGRPKGIATLLALAAVAPACADADAAAPRCEPDQRLGIVAQSAPDAAYVPCVAELPPGWSFESVDVGDEGARLSLRSDRSDQDVTVELVDDCDVGSATPVAPRDEGVRTYQQVDSVSSRYAGRFYDVFAGGCVIYGFDFARGPHIALVDEMLRAVHLYPRRQLRQELRADLGITLDE